MVHKGLIALGFLMLFWPAATTNLFGDGLSGYVPSSATPSPTLSSWFSGEFQSTADQWWKERFGMRFFFVKLDNQVHYWLTGEPGGVHDQLVFGRDGWLYERHYVDGYCQVHDRSDESQVRETLAGVRRLQDAMDARGVSLVLLIAPSKAAVYPQWIPEGECAARASPGLDYEFYRPLLDEYGLRYVDGFAATQSAKAEWPGITLFARGGTHWSLLGAYYSAKQVLESASQDSEHPIPPLELGDVTMGDRASGFDRDLVDFQNLLFPDVRYPVSHPEFSMDRGATRGVRVVLVGTSFLQQLGAIYAQSDGFDRVDHYWYYEHNVRNVLTDESKPLVPDGVDFEGEILSADVVVLDMIMLAFHGEHIRRFVEDGLTRLDDTPTAP